MKDYHGAEIKLNGEQTGAISFAGTEKKVRLARSLPPNLREVLPGAVYGLILQTWMSDSWQQRQASAGQMYTGRTPDSRQTQT